ncbi:XRE family transcriptional regulator [Streptomyces pluripotens]|uniref:XRE family transcriptional regulator n=1 Tax=Streptomyces pluripotens TaxID=1355015 RepID=A0A221NS03_9ACTN
MTRSPAGSVSDRPFAHLAEHLTALRRAARLPQRALADTANISRGAVQRAESGTAAPSPTVLDAYLRACGAGPASTARALLLRSRGRAAHRDKLRELRAPAPAFIHDKRDLALALAEAYERAGAPSLGDARLAPGRKPLPRTTAWRIVNRKGLPATTEQLVTFLTACGIRPAEQRPYLDAYQRITTDRGTRPTPPRTQRIARRIHRTPLAYGGTDTEVSYELTATTAALARLVPARVLEEAFTTALQQYADREAHRNGTTPPDWITTTHILDRLAATPFIARAPDHANDSGADLVLHTSDGSTMIIQAKRHSRPTRPDALAPTPAPTDRAA